MTAALLVPVLVGFALEVPADAIDRIASPFIGQASAAVVTRKTEDDGLRRAMRTSMAPQLYPAGIVTSAPRRLPAAVAAPTSPVRRARRILPLDEWAGAPASAPPRADEPAPTTVVRRPRSAPLPGDEDVPVQPDHGSTPAVDEPPGGTAPRTTPPDTGAGRPDGGASPGPAAPDTGGGAGETAGGGEPVAGDGGGEGDPDVAPPVEPPPADGPGNSESAPGHVEDGPGNSENAPGQAKKDKGGA